MFLKKLLRLGLMSIPTATFVRRVLQRNQREQHTSMFKNSRNVEMTTITSLRCQLGTSSLISISRNPGSYLASFATWEIFSATPIGNGLSPVLNAVPNLSSSQDETFSILTSSFAAAANLSAWGNLIRYVTLFPSLRVTERTTCLPSSVATV